MSGDEFGMGCLSCAAYRQIADADAPDRRAEATEPSAVEHQVTHVHHRSIDGGKGQEQNLETVPHGEFYIHTEDPEVPDVPENTIIF